MQDFSNHLVHLSPAPFLKLTPSLHSPSIQSTTVHKSSCPTFFLYNNPFHLIVCHNTEKRVFSYFATIIIANPCLNCNINEYDSEWVMQIMFPLSTDSVFWFLDGQLQRPGQTHQSSGMYRTTLLCKTREEILCLPGFWNVNEYAVIFFF